MTPGKFLLLWQAHGRCSMPAIITFLQTHEILFNPGKLQKNGPNGWETMQGRLRQVAGPLWLPWGAFLGNIIRKEGRCHTSPHKALAALGGESRCDLITAVPTPSDSLPWQTQLTWSWRLVKIVPATLNELPPTLWDGQTMAYRCRSEGLAHKNYSEELWGNGEGSEDSKKTNGFNLQI